MFISLSLYIELYSSFYGHPEMTKTSQTCTLNWFDVTCRGKQMQRLSSSSVPWLFPCLQTKQLMCLLETHLFILFMCQLNGHHWICACVSYEAESCKQAEGVSEHILILFGLPRLFLIVQQILSNLINTGCSRLICVVTCLGLCFALKAA